MNSGVNTKGNSESSARYERSMMYMGRIITLLALSDTLLEEQLPMAILEERDALRSAILAAYVKIHSTDKRNAGYDELQQIDMIYGNVIGALDRIEIEFDMYNRTPGLGAS